MQNNSSSFSLLWRRCAAFLYDCLLLTAVYFLVTTLAIALNDGQAIEHSGYKIVLLAVAYMFFDWFWRHGGQTLGMRAWKLQLINQKKAPITRIQTFKRFVAGSLLFGFTLLYLPFNDAGMALHDRFSGTKIILNNN